MEFNLNTIIQICTLLGLIFAVYLYFRKPQEESFINDKVFEERMLHMREASRVEITGIKELVTNLRDNHLHTIESKLDGHIKDQHANELCIAKQVERITTILDERIPKQK